MVLLDYLIWFNRSSVGCVSEFHFAKKCRNFVGYYDRDDDFTRSFTHIAV